MSETSLGWGKGCIRFWGRLDQFGGFIATDSSHRVKWGTHTFKIITEIKFVNNKQSDKCRQNGRLTAQPYRRLDVRSRVLSNETTVMYYTYHTLISIGPTTSDYWRPFDFAKKNVKCQIQTTYHFSFLYITNRPWATMFVSRENNKDTDRLSAFEPRHEKIQHFAYAKTKAQISFAVTAKLTAKLISAPLFSLHRKYNLSSF